MSKTTYHMWVIYGPQEMTEGTGRKDYIHWGLFTTEQGAWDFVNEKGGVMGGHPRDWPRAATTWQECEADPKCFSHYHVRQIDIIVHGPVSDLAQAGGIGFGVPPKPESEEQPACDDDWHEYSGFKRFMSFSDKCPTCGEKAYYAR